MASIEKELGTCLFERKPKFRLTQTGERFYQYCVKFRELNDSMVNEFRDMSGNVSDILQVGISQTRSQIIMPKLLRCMRKELPYVQARIIGESAFESASTLSAIHIPKNVTEIGNYAFAWCTDLE